MASAAEVLVKLVVDSNAPKATAELQHGLEKVEPHRKKFVKGLLDGRANMAVLGTVSKAALGYMAAGAAAAGGALIGAAVGAAHAFHESEEQVRALTSTIALLDTSGTSFSKIHDIASGLKDELEDVAMAVGTTDDAMVAAFTDVIERGGKSIDQAQELTEQMAKAGRAVPGGVGMISGAFEMIEMGAVKAKNPIVGMIAATHMLQGNTKQVAKQMQAMRPEEQMKLAEKAISNMAKKMDAVPLSIDEMATSMKVFVGNLFEDAGKPIMEGLVPVFSTVRGWLKENSGMMKGVASAFGGMVGKVVEVALPVANEIFAAIKASSGDIKAAFAAVYGPGMELFGYIYENKGAFAKTIGDVLRQIVHVVSELVKGLAAARDLLVSMVSSVASITPGVGSFAKEEKQTGMIKDLRTGIAATGATPKDFDDMRKAYIALSADIDPKQAATAGAAFDEARTRAMNDHNVVLQQAGIAERAIMMGETSAYVAAFDAAATAHDGATQANIARFLKDNESMAEALRIKGPDIFKTGSEGFIKALEAADAGEQAKKLSEGWKKGARGETSLGKGPVMNQYIGTVNVKQDFKDIDPERVAIVFRNDLAKHGMQRLQPLGAKPGF